MFLMVGELDKITPTTTDIHKKEWAVIVMFDVTF